MASEAMKAAQRKAASPEARAKAVATMKRRRAEKEALAFANAEKAAKVEDAKNRPRKSALLKHAKITKDQRRLNRLANKKRKVQSIPLDMIPDMPKKRTKAKPGKSMGATRQEVVLALLKYLNDE